MSSASTLFALYAVRPLIRREIPGWGKLYALFVGGHRANARWAEALLAQLTRSV